MKTKNPYRPKSNYFKLFGFLRKHEAVTQRQLELFARRKLHLSSMAAKASATIILSPRASSKRGNCHGNISAKGHLYFMEKDGNKFRLRFRHRLFTPMASIPVSTPATLMARLELKGKLLDARADRLEQEARIARNKTTVFHADVESLIDDMQALLER